MATVNTSTNTSTGTSTSSNAGAISFSGLASGIDTSQIVEQLISVDSARLKKLQKQETEITTQKDTYTTIQTDLNTLKTAVEDLKDASSYNVFSATSSDTDALTVSATTSAREGNYSVKIISLAQAEALSSNSYASTDTSLGVSGEILINDKTLTIRATDTLSDIKSAINSLDQDVRATTLTVADSDNRLILTASSQGEDGFRIANVGENDVLGALGLTDSTKSVRETTDGKVYSAEFSSALTTIGSLTGISGESKGTVKIRDESLKIDLSTDTLSSIRDKINALGIKGVSAEVESVTESGSTVYSLSVTGTQDFTDSGNVLETLGILEGGTSGVKSQFQTGDLTILTSDTKENTVNDTTKLTKLGASEGETITISGADADGVAVSSTVQITKQTKISDLLKEIQSAFSGNVTATLEDGKISVKSAVTGESSFSVNIIANNEKDGTLDFGTMSNTQVGRERQIAEGSNAKLKVNNITVSRSSNVISNAIEGLSLTLKEADAGTTLNITVERDTDAIKEKIQTFVDSYNSLVDYVDEQSKYDSETDTAGPLVGDTTTTSVLTQIRGILRGTVNEDGLTYTQLQQIGVETTSDGHLKIDTETLNEALKEDVDGISSLLSIDRSSTNSDISFVYSSTKTKAGSYKVEITQAAEKATIISDTAMELASSSGTLTLTDNFGSVMTVDYSKGDSTDDIANAINTEASKKYTQIIQSETALTTSDGEAITQNTAIADIEGVTIDEGDSITISGTDHSGSTYQRRVTLSDDTGSYSVQDVLTAIEEAADSNISASLDSEGHIQVIDKTTGNSKLALSISTTISGLDFGTISTVQAGRNAVTVDASVTDDNRLTLSHASYGSSNALTASGGTGIGITDGTYKGKDVAGTINGVAGTGNGQSLTASSSDASTQGIVLNVKLSAEDLASTDKSKGTVKLVSGIADSLYRGLSSLTDAVNGLIQTKIDSFQRSIDSTNEDISNEENRLALRKQMYTTKYSNLEKSLSMLQNVQSQLTSLLSTI